MSDVAQKRGELIKFEEWCVEAETAEEARELLANAGHPQLADPSAGIAPINQWPVSRCSRRSKRDYPPWTRVRCVR